ncbi:uncharacterized protein PAC_09805 [Phialocephala subalpina]|uniref:Mitotic-spindle organizing protein 1 n=1 Tax=Phialocephala subalpina TaxID=576137 RepID=A0A1L7X4H3_9HELO|nr:uncharacterized protein PAC_09805 [Phialocephala subalpina]
MPKSDQMPKKDQVPEKQQELKGMQAHREGLDILHEISTLLNTPLTYRQLAICTSLIEEGVNPETLASVVKVLMAEHPEEENSKGSA